MKHSPTWYNMSGHAPKPKTISDDSPPHHPPGPEPAFSSIFWALHQNVKRRPSLYAVLWRLAFRHLYCGPTDHRIQSLPAVSRVGAVQHVPCSALDEFIKVLRTTLHYWIQNFQLFWNCQLLAISEILILCNLWKLSEQNKKFTNCQVSISLTAIKSWPILCELCTRYYSSK